MNTTKKVFCVLILIFISTIFLSSCGVYSLSNFVLPNDLEFITLIKELDTPQKISDYMISNFIYEYHALPIDPYTSWLTNRVDCSDCVDFAMLIANYHEYTTYSISIYFKGAFT